MNIGRNLDRCGQYLEAATEGFERGLLGSIIGGLCGGMMAYLYGVNCNGQLDHFVVFWYLILCRPRSAGSSAGVRGGGYLVWEG